MQKRNGPKARKLQALIEEKLKTEVTDIWWEPRNGPCIEMQGYAGGWYYEGIDEDGDEVFHPLGYSYEDAVELIELLSKHY